MPAIDKCEEAIVRALEKDGWKLVRRPEAIRLEETRFLYVDLLLKNIEGNTLIVVEVKCFPQNSSETDELYRAIGQYILYQSILTSTGRTETLYLAIPKSTYDNLFQIAAVQIAINSAKIKLVVIDVQKEVVVVWKT